jgi:hypothetical protein
VAFEGGVHDAALLRLVAVVEQVSGHGPSIVPLGRADIGAAP